MNRHGKRTVLDDSADVIDAALRDSDVVRGIADICERIARDETRDVHEKADLTAGETAEVQALLFQCLISHPLDASQILCAVLMAYARNVLMARLSP